MAWARTVGGIVRTPEGRVDYGEDFFGKPAFLTVSGQLNGEYLRLRALQHLHLRAHLPVRCCSSSARCTCLTSPACQAAASPDVGPSRVACMLHAAAASASRAPCMCCAHVLRLHG